MKSTVCAYFASGNCRFGTSCKNVHQGAQDRPTGGSTTGPSASQPRHQHVDGCGRGQRGGQRRGQQEREFADLHHQMERVAVDGAKGQAVGGAEPLRSMSAGGTGTAARPRGTTVSDVWTPPTEVLQRIQVDSYSLFFPLELTNKDYMRRVLDIVAIGIRDRVISITADRRLPPLSSDNDSDVYYLLKQLLGGEGFQKPENAAATQTQRSVFADALGAPNAQQMSNAAKYLYEMRNRLAHMVGESSRLTLLTVMFDCARDLSSGVA